MKLTVISLGWGVQSWGLAAMSALGVLPPVDMVIHADTTHERSKTYAFAKKWTPWLEAHGMSVITVSDKSAASQITDNTKRTHAPLYTVSQKNGSQGKLRRSCTQRWKIAPKRRYIAAELEKLKVKKTPGIVEQWFGITLDEVERMRVNDVKYIDSRYPFITMLDRPWTRGEVTDWLLKNNLEVPVKSACVFCPFHNRDAWREIKNENGKDWQRAVVVDEIIRDKRPGYVCYLTPALKPLAKTDFRNAEDMGQISLWPSDECSGNCFL